MAKCPFPIPLAGLQRQSSSFSLTGHTWNSEDMSSMASSQLDTAPELSRFSEQTLEAGKVKENQTKPNQRIQFHKADASLLM